MIIVTNGYIFINSSKNEINNIIENTKLEHNEKTGDNYCRKIEFKNEIQFLIK